MNDIKITAEPSSTGELCTFKISIPLLRNEALKCLDTDQAKGSPLLEDLFKLEGIREVLVGHDIVKIKRAGNVDWKILGKDVGQVLRSHLSGNGKLFAEDWKERLAVGDSYNSAPDGKQFDTKEGRAIQKIINEQVNPALKAHGGFANLIDIKDHKVYLRMGGGCQGCAQVDATLKEGIMKLIKQHVPSVKEVIDVTDHASGDNPYYS